jgi:N-methylhydantoinase A/oxoprolinase/acetone carboxylase beta subunit
LIFTAIDIGGTFTDLIDFDDTAGRFTQAKGLTTPHHHLVQGIIDCIRKSGLDARAIDELIHGSTIAIARQVGMSQTVRWAAPACRAAHLGSAQIRQKT